MYLLKKITIIYLLLKSAAFATCHSSVYDGYEYKALLQDLRQAELIYTCLNVYDELENEDRDTVPNVDFCIYKSKDYPLYVEIYTRDEKSDDGEFQVGLLDDLAWPIKKSYENDNEIFILQDSRDVFGIGYSAKLTINKKSNNGNLLITNKYDDDGVASIFSPTKKTNLSFKCNKVKVKTK